MTARGHGAGSAFARVLASDPEARAAWERASTHLRALGDAWTSVTRDLGEERMRVVREFESAIREALQASGDELAAAGFEAPRTLEEWEQLAHLVEMPFGTVRSGEFSLADVRVVALAWVERMRMKARLAASGGGLGESGSTKVTKGTTGSLSMDVARPIAPAAGSRGGQNKDSAPMPEAILRAGASLEWVRRERDDLLPPVGSKERYTQAQYDHLAEHGCESYPPDARGKPTVPNWDTWSRYVREYLRLTDGRVNSTRRGRTGRSLARPDDLDDRLSAG